MAVVPTFKNNSKLPVYECADKGLQQALNTLARAIESLSIPDVRLTSGAGTMEWNGSDVLLRPSTPVTNQSRPPWSPVYHSDENGESQVSFSAGTINNVIASNWNAKFSLNITEPEQYKFVVLTVTSASGIVTNATLSLESTPVTTDFVSKGVPPTMFKYTLGVFWLSGYQMLVDHNLQASGEVVFTESRTAITPGDIGYDNWYRWHVTFIDPSYLY